MLVSDISPRNTADGTRFISGDTAEYAIHLFPFAAENEFLLLGYAF